MQVRYDLGIIAGDVGVDALRDDRELFELLGFSGADDEAAGYRDQTNDQIATMSKQMVDTQTLLVESNRLVVESTKQIQASIKNVVSYARMEYRMLT